MKAIVSVGVSASGKTTAAKEWVQECKGRFILSRDVFRNAILSARHGEVLPGDLWKLWKFTRSNEQEVTTRYFAAMDKCAELNFDLFCADTNLNKAHRDGLIARLTQLGYEVEVRDFPVTLEEAWKRDERRADSVGRDVIYKQWKQWQEYIGNQHYHNSTDLPAAVICDIDGTLAHMNGNRGPYDWGKVYADELDYHVAHLVQCYHYGGLKVILLSGRDAICRAETERWLTDHSIPFDQLHMRSHDDMRSDVIVKRELFDEHIRDKYHVWAVIDDRPKVCRMWRDLGLKVFQVGDPHHEF